ncbi:MAG: GNAT family N-acetyltransferase [Candidatus Nanopelagicales bacterium]
MANETQVVQRPETDRYEILTDGQVAGFVTYHEADDVVVLDHTEVQPAFEGEGLAGDLARGTFEDLRARGVRVQPLCSYMASWVGKHPEYADLVVPDEQPG